MQSLSIPCVAHYLVDKVHSTNCSDFPHIVHQTEVAVASGVEFFNVYVPKAFEERCPHICSYAVPNGSSDHMVFVIITLLKNQGATF